MYLPKKDVIATGLMAAASLLCLLWGIGSALPGMSSTRATGVAVLALGLTASVSAVAPTFGALRVITGRAHPHATAAHGSPKAARPPTASCSPLDHRDSAERGSDHAD